MRFLFRGGGVFSKLVMNFLLLATLNFMDGPYKGKKKHLLENMILGKISMIIKIYAQSTLVMKNNA